MADVKAKADKDANLPVLGQHEHSKAGKELDQADNISLVLSKYGTSQSYLARRLKRDHPDIFKAQEERRECESSS